MVSLFFCSAFERFEATNGDSFHGCCIFVDFFFFLSLWVSISLKHRPNSFTMNNEQQRHEQQQQTRNFTTLRWYVYISQCNEWEQHLILLVLLWFFICWTVPKYSMCTFIWFSSFSLEISDFDLLFTNSSLFPVFCYQRFVRDIGFHLICVFCWESERERQRKRKSDKVESKSVADWAWVWEWEKIKRKRKDEQFAWNKHVRVTYAWVSFVRDIVCCQVIEKCLSARFLALESSTQSTEMYSAYKFRNLKNSKWMIHKRK